VTTHFTTNQEAAAPNIDTPLTSRASEATLLAAAVILANIESAASGGATEATLALIKAKTDNLDVFLSTRASEATLAALSLSIGKNDTDLSFTRQGIAFLLSTNFANVPGTTETPFLLFKNPAASGFDALSLFLRFASTSSTARTTLRLYANPTITANGTALSIFNARAGDATVSAMEGYLNPTVSANGTLIAPFLSTGGSSGLEIEKAIQITPGVNILMSIQNSVGNVDTFINLKFAKIPTGT
jgi:hypothetical protein